MRDEIEKLGDLGLEAEFLLGHGASPSGTMLFAAPLICDGWRRSARPE
jgi:hypothetical protein